MLVRFRKYQNHYYLNIVEPEHGAHLMLCKKEVEKIFGEDVHGKTYRVLTKDQGNCKEIRYGEFQGPTRPGYFIFLNDFPTLPGVVDSAEFFSVLQREVPAKGRRLVDELVSTEYTVYLQEQP